MPYSPACRISVRLIGHSRPDPAAQQCSAAAEMMPSNEPPMPTASGRWCRGWRIDRGRMPLSAITLMARRPANLGDQVVVPGPVEHHRGDVPHLASERLGDRPQVLSHPGAGRSWAFATGPTAIFFMYIRGTRVRRPARTRPGIESAHPASPTTAAPSIGSQASSIHAAAAHGRARCADGLLAGRS